MSKEVRNLLNSMKEKISLMEELDYRTVQSTEFNNHQQIRRDYVANHPLVLSDGRNLKDLNYHQNNDGTFGFTLTFDHGWISIDLTNDKRSVTGSRFPAKPVVRFDGMGSAWEKDKDNIIGWVYKAMVSAQYSADIISKVVAGLTRFTGQPYGTSPLAEALQEMKYVAKTLGVNNMINESKVNEISKGLATAAMQKADTLKGSTDHTQDPAKYQKYHDQSNKFRRYVNPKLEQMLQKMNAKILQTEESGFRIGFNSPDGSQFVFVVWIGKEGVIRVDQGDQRNLTGVAAQYFDQLVRAIKADLGTQNQQQVAEEMTIGDKGELQHTQQGQAYIHNRTGAMVFITKDEGNRMIAKILTGGRTPESVDVGEEVVIYPDQLLTDYSPAELTPDQLKSAEIMGTHVDTKGGFRRAIGRGTPSQVNEDGIEEPKIDLQQQANRRSGW